MAEYDDNDDCDMDAGDRYSDGAVPQIDPSDGRDSARNTEKRGYEEIGQNHDESSNNETVIRSFEDTGLLGWLCRVCSSMGYTGPTPIQQKCIPLLLHGKNVMGFAETGSGKTAAFALPMLHILSLDVYGIFSVILSPTRELASQISEQLSAFGAHMKLKHCLIVGGMNMTSQSLELQRRPHIIIATPGRLSDHLRGPSPPDLSRARFLVFDEADTLLTREFEEDVSTITLAMRNPKLQMCLFSATHTSVIDSRVTNHPALTSLDMEKLERIDLSHSAATPVSLTEEYLFIPSRLKLSYLVATLHAMVKLTTCDEALEKKLKREKSRQDSIRLQKRGKTRSVNDMKFNDLLEEALKIKKTARRDALGMDSYHRRNEAKVEEPTAQSAIVFVNTRQGCHELSLLLLKLGIDNACLHSFLPQARRAITLSKFKSLLVNLLICTDVGSRGLDIPTVELVVNFDVPTSCVRYIHRVGRTARSGREGRALTFITENDVSMVHKIESEFMFRQRRIQNSSIEETCRFNTVCQDVTEDMALKWLDRCLKADKMVRLKLEQEGYYEMAERKNEEDGMKKRRRLRSNSHDQHEDSDVSNI